MFYSMLKLNLLHQTTDIIVQQATQWAEGNTSNVIGLVFSDFKSAAPKSNGSPRVKDMVGRNYVVHLVTDNIYIDLKMLSWQQYGNGGGFSYERSTNPNLSVEYKDAVDVFYIPILRQDLFAQTKI